MTDTLFILEHSWDYGEGEYLEFCGVFYTFEQAAWSPRMVLDWKKTSETTYQANYAHDKCWFITVASEGVFYEPDWLEKPKEKTEVDDFLDYIDETYKVNND